MRLALVHAASGTRELLRLPAYVVPTLGFPTLFFLFFAAPNAGADASLAMALFAGFAIIGVAFFQFGVGIATERATPWETYLRTLPLPPSSRFGGRVLSALLFGIVAAALVLVAGVSTTSASLAPAEWVELGVALTLCATPFALFGIALGYLASPRAALPIANVVYLSLSYCGGLWTKPENLPDALASVSPALPTRALADTLAGIAESEPLQLRAWLLLVGYTLVFAWIAVWAYRRDEGQRYR